MTTRARRPRDRKQHIAAAAADLFASRGYAAVGIDDIGRAVGVSGPAIYRHFEGKDALLFEIATSTMTQIDEALVVAGAGASTFDSDKVLRSGVVAILDHRAGLITAIRELRRLIDAGFPEADAVRRRMDGHWRDVLRSLNPDLDRIASAMRLRAMLGPAMTQAPPDVGRRRLEELCVSSIGAILSVPQQVTNGHRVVARRWEPPANKRSVLLRTAVQLFNERGFAGVGVHEIGEPVGIAAPTVYHYYPVKADILVDAFDVAAQRFSAAIDEALAAATSALDALERLARSYARVVFEDFDLLEVTHLAFDELPEQERPRIVRQRRHLEDRWVDVLRDLRPELGESESRLLVAMTFPLIHLAVHGARVPIERIDDVVAVAVAHLTASSTQASGRR